MITAKAMKISQLPYMVHPRGEEILETAEKQGRTIGLVGNTRYSEYATMSIYLYPWGEVQRIVDAVHFFNALYLLDDNYGEDTGVSNTRKPELTRDVLTRSWTGSIGSDGLEGYPSIFRQIGQRIRYHCTPSYFEFLSQALAQHIDYQLAPRTHRSIEQYISHRREVSGMRLTVDMLQYIDGLYPYEFLNREKESDLIDEIETCVTEIGALTNDVFSYPKEKDYPESNIVGMLMKHNPNLSIEDSVGQAVQIVNVKYKEFLNKTEELKGSSRSEDAIKYLQGLEAIVSASYHWQLSTQRYRHPEHYIAEMQG